MAKSRRERTAKPQAEEPQAEPPRVNPAKERLGEIIKEQAEGEGVPLPFGSKAELFANDVDVPADGTLIRGDGGPVVYVMQDGKRRPLGDANVFAACGFGWNDIVVLSPEEIDRISTGDVVARQGDLQRGA